MSKWRPSDLNCLYVIPDIHGNIETLNLILDRILPLRKSDGGKDRLVFLGDYIDRHINSHLVIDRLIEIKKKYPNQIVFIKGNHEAMLLQLTNKVPGKTYTLQDQTAAYNVWEKNGGIATLKGYLLRNNNNSEPLSIERFRIVDYIPKEHWDFFQSLENYWEFEQYQFLHAGCQPDTPLREQMPEKLYWDRKLYQYMKEQFLKPDDQKDLLWDKTIVAGHNGPDMFFHEKFMMLDAGSPERLVVIELQSMEGMIANPGYDRLVKFVPQPGPNLASNL